MIRSSLLSLLVLVLACAFEFSCSRNESLPSSTELQTVNVNLNFTIEDIPWQVSSTRAVGAPDVNSVTLTVFDTENKPVLTQSQDANSSDFGSFTNLRLAPGDYKFAVVAYCDTAKVITPATISSLTSATIPRNLLYDTHTTVKEFTVLKGDYSSQPVNISVPLCVSSLKLVLLDAIPQDVASVNITVNEGGILATSPIALNPSTGLASTNLSYSRTWNVTSAIGAKETSFTIYGLFNEYPKSTPIKIEALNSNSEVLFSRTYPTGVTLKLATHHVLYTNLFTGKNETTVSFDKWQTAGDTITIE